MFYLMQLKTPISLKDCADLLQSEFAGDATGFGMDFGGAGSALPRVITFGLNVNF